MIKADNSGIIPYKYLIDGGFAPKGCFIQWDLCLFDSVVWLYLTVYDKNGNVDSISGHMALFYKEINELCDDPLQFYKSHIIKSFSSKDNINIIAWMLIIDSIINDNNFKEALFKCREAM
jgi:hypothetical protein